MACQSRGAHHLLLNLSLSVCARRRYNPELCPAPTAAVQALRVCDRGHSARPCAPWGVPRRPAPPFPHRARPRSAPLAAPRGSAASPRCCGQRGRGALIDCSGFARQEAEGLYAGLQGAADARRGEPRGASPAEPGPAQPPHRPAWEAKLTG